VLLVVVIAKAFLAVIAKAVARLVNSWDREEVGLSPAIRCEPDRSQLPEISGGAENVGWGIRAARAVAAVNEPSTSARRPSLFVAIVDRVASVWAVVRGPAEEPASTAWSGMSDALRVSAPRGSNSTGMLALEGAYRWRLSAASLSCWAS